jgi:hypothetical protein
MEKVLGVEVPAAKVVVEPVLDGPAIDMTDAAEKSPRRSSRKATATRSAKGSGPRRRTSGREARAERPKRNRDGSIGRDTFESVEALVKNGKTKTEAFTQVATDTSRNVGTVSANYYRVARANGAVKPRRPRNKVSTSTSTQGRQNGTHRVKQRNASNGNSIDDVVGQLVASVQALTRAVKAQAAEVRKLRRRLDGVRGFLG